MLEEKVREAILTELRRQSAEGRDGLSVSEGEDDMMRVEGVVDLEALATAVVGAVAGGP